MNDLRFWSVVLALTAFLAGLAGGILIAPVLRPPQAEERVPFGDYQALLRETFDLDAERSAALLSVMEEYDMRLEGEKAKQVAAIYPELGRLGLQYRGFVREYVIPADRQSEFDRLARGFPVPTTMDR